MLTGQVSNESIERAADESIARLAIDDPRHFGELYNRYVDRVFRYCAVKLGDVESAQDATSLVFIKAMTGIASFKGGCFSAWLFRIAHNVVVDLQRANRAMYPFDMEAEVHDPADPVEVIAIRNDEAQRLHRLLKQLTEDQQQVIGLRLAGLNGNEIADALGMRRNTVDVIARRAMLKLKALMTEAGGAR